MLYNIGWKYVCIDDGWQKHKRKRDKKYKKLEYDPVKFPNGMFIFIIR